MSQRDSMPLVEETGFKEDELEDLLKSLPGRFEDCRFEGIKFLEARVGSSEFIDCEFTRCNLAGVNLRGARFRDVKFVECNLTGVNWSTLSKFESCIFRGCKLDYAIFMGLKLRRLQLLDCSLKEADFSGAELIEADFSLSRLSGASFTRADLSKADLKTAVQYFIDPAATKIKGAKFCLPEALSLLSALGIEIDS